MIILLIIGVMGFLGGVVLEKIFYQEIWLDLLLLVCVDSFEVGFEWVKENMCKFNIVEEKLVMLCQQYILLGDFVFLEYFFNDLCFEQVIYVFNCVVVVLFGSNLFIWKVNVEGMLCLV